MNKKLFIKNSFICTKIVFRLEPAGTCFYVIANVLYALFWMLQTLSMQSFFDTAERAAAQLSQTGGVEVLTVPAATSLVASAPMSAAVSLTAFSSTPAAASLATALLLMGGAYLGYHILDGINNGYCDILLLKLYRGLNDMLFARIDRMNALEFEDAARLDALEKARNGSERLPGITFTLLDILFHYIAYFLFIGGYLFRQNPTLIASIVIVFIPVMISKLATAAMHRNEEEEEAPLRRRIDHYEKCLTKKEFLKETRLWGANAFFEKRYRDSLTQQNRLQMALITKKNLLQIALSAVTACGYGLIAWMLFSSVMGNEISLGTFVAVLTTLRSLFRCMNKMVSERLGWAADNIGAVENYLHFVMEETPTAESCSGANWTSAASEAPVDSKFPSDRPTSAPGLVLDRVSFRYPQAAQNALDRISLTIPAGQTVALVGENGSGKSTLAKILLGLYYPTQGRITYGGTNATSVSPPRASAVFQKYAQYQMTLRENLTIGEAFQNDDEKLRAACTSCGVTLSSPDDGQHLPNDSMQPSGSPATLPLDTMLGREFDGAELSGGQWQRIAIGRGIYRNHDLIVLDEPTAAIDPLEETRIYRQFAQLCRDKTAVLITHRLGAARLADRILVLQNGRLVQDGSHEELLRADGPYRQMYESQSTWYQSAHSACNAAPANDIVKAIPQ